MSADLHARISSMRAESRDPAFTGYLNELEKKITEAESKITACETSLNESYERYKKRFPDVNAAPVYEPVSPAVPVSPAAPVAGAAPVIPPRQAGVNPAMAMPPRPADPANANNAFNAGFNNRPAGANPAPAMNGPAPSAPVRLAKASDGGMEFKIGTVILSVVGSLFVLIALIIFGINYMADNSIVQGVFFYALCIAIIAVSELVFSKRIEKFSYVLTGLGIGGIYVTTVLGYLYLKIFPIWAASIIIFLVTAFFFFFSKKKESEIIRTISVLGCYISIFPLDEINSLSEFVVPAIVLLLVSLGGIFYPVKYKRSVVVDLIQTVCMLISIAVLDNALKSAEFCLGERLDGAGYSSWLTFILLACEVVLAHIIYKREILSEKGEDMLSKFLYFMTLSISYLYLWGVMEDENWIYFGILGVAVLTPVLCFILHKEKFEYVPYFYLTGLTLWTFLMDSDRFWFAIAALVFFAANKLIAFVLGKYRLYDVVYSTTAACYVCVFLREGDVRFLGYIFALCILASVVISKEYKRYMTYMAVTFAWVFLISEDCEPFIPSILITLLALGMILFGFLKKRKGIRVYGLCLVIAVAFKIVLFDFAHSETGFRILVFLIVGILIIAVSLLYILSEKKEQELKGMHPILKGDAYQPGMPASSAPVYQGVKAQPMMQQGAPYAQAAALMQGAQVVQPVQPVVQPGQPAAQPAVQPAQPVRQPVRGEAPAALSENNIISQENSENE